MVVVVAEAAGAADELAEDDVAQRVAAPPLRVAPRHLLGLLPALLLHRVREAPGLRRGRRVEQLVQVGDGGGGGGGAGGGRPGRGTEGLRRRRRRVVGAAPPHRLPAHHYLHNLKSTILGRVSHRVLAMRDYFRTNKELAEQRARVVVGIMFGAAAMSISEFDDLAGVGVNADDFIYEQSVTDMGQLFFEIEARNLTFVAGTLQCDVSGFERKGYRLHTFTVSGGVYDQKFFVLYKEHDCVLYDSIIVSGDAALIIYAEEERYLAVREYYAVERRHGVFTEEKKITGEVEETLERLRALDTHGYTNEELLLWRLIIRVFSINADVATRYMSVAKVFIDYPWTSCGINTVDNVILRSRIVDVIPSLRRNSFESSVADANLLNDYLEVCLSIYYRCDEDGGAYLWSMLYMVTMPMLQFEFHSDFGDVLASLSFVASLKGCFLTDDDFSKGSVVGDLADMVTAVLPCVYQDKVNRSFSQFDVPGQANFTGMFMVQRQLFTMNFLRFYDDQRDFERKFVGTLKYGDVFNTALWSFKFIELPYMGYLEGYLSKDAIMDVEDFGDFFCYLSMIKSKYRGQVLRIMNYAPFLYHVNVVQFSGIDESWFRSKVYKRKLGSVIHYVSKSSKAVKMKPVSCLRERSEIVKRARESIDAVLIK